MNRINLKSTAVIENKSGDNFNVRYRYERESAYMNKVEMARGSTFITCEANLSSLLCDFVPSRLSGIR